MAGVSSDEPRDDLPDSVRQAQGASAPPLPRTDLQALVLGVFTQELLRLPSTSSALDDIGLALDELSALPDAEVSDEVIASERDRRLAGLATQLDLPWPWIRAELGIGLWWRQQLVESELLSAQREHRVRSELVPGWPPTWTGDRRSLAVGGGPWAVMGLQLAPRFAVKRGDSTEVVRQRWAAIAAQVSAALRSSMFSMSAEDGPPHGAPRDDVAAYSRYARWAVRKLAGGESYREIAAGELRPVAPAGQDAKTGHAEGRGERWREVRRGVAKAIEVLDSI
jgi:hypothetical protein